MHPDSHKPPPEQMGNPTKKIKENTRVLYLHKGASFFSVSHDTVNTLFFFCPNPLGVITVKGLSE